MKTRLKENYKKALINHIREGNWQSYGAGEVGCDLYIEKHHDDCTQDELERAEYYLSPEPVSINAGELSGDNGCNRYYNESGEPWAESISDKSDKYFLNLKKLLWYEYPATYYMIFASVK